MHEEVLCAIHGRPLVTAFANEENAVGATNQNLALTEPSKLGYRG
jgi:hypothetical protein